MQNFFSFVLYFNIIRTFPRPGFYPIIPFGSNYLFNCNYLFPMYSVFAKNRKQCRSHVDECKYIFFYYIEPN